MRTWTAVWSGQMESVIGTTLTEFGVSAWVHQKTGSATMFAMILLFTVVPDTLISPLAGPLLHRRVRRKIHGAADQRPALTSEPRQRKAGGPPDHQTGDQTRSPIWAEWLPAGKA
jgi:hypothetical protein